LPVGPAPEQALLALDKDGRLRLWRERTVYVGYRSFGPGGKPTTKFLPTTELREERHDPAEVRVTDARGRVIAPKALAKLVKGETLVLVSADGRPVDPLHLRLVKDGTLVLVPPAAPPAVPSVPAAAGPPLAPPVTDLRQESPRPRQ
jgi:hypothetical protein